MKKALALACAAWLASWPAAAETISGGVGGGGGGSGSVTSIATSCGLSGGPITSTGTISGSISTAAKTADYTFQMTDCGALVTFTSASAMAGTLTNASFSAGNYINVRNLPGAAGVLTLTPSAGTIDGGASLAVQPSQGLTVVFDGTNWTTSGRYVVGPSSATNGDLPSFNGTGGQTLQDSGVAAANVVQGPASAVSGHLATFSGTSGKLIADGGAIPTGFQPIASYKSSNWYRSLGSIQQTAGSTNVTTSSVYCHPYVISAQGITVKAIAINASTTGVGNASMAIYKADGPAGRPGTLIDTLATPQSTAAATVSGSLVNAAGGDALPSGMSWVCTSADNTTVRFTSISAGIGAWDQPLIGAATVSALYSSAATVTGVSCTSIGSPGSGTGTCGAAFGAWSAGAFTWGASLSGVTWTDVTQSIMPEVSLQAF